MAVSVSARRSWVRPAILIGLLAAMAVLARAGDVPERLSALAGSARAPGPWTPAALVGVYALRPLTLVPVTPLWILSGALLGWGAGAAWSVVGTSVGAAIGFALARRLGRDFVERRFSRLGRLGRVEPGHGLRTVLALQLTPVMPHDLINALAGVSRMPYRLFFVGSLVGSLPIIVLYTYVGSAVLEVDSPRFWIAAGLLTALTIGMLGWNRRLARRQPRNEPSKEG